MITEQMESLEMLEELAQEESAPARVELPRMQSRQSEGGFVASLRDLAGKITGIKPSTPEPKVHERPTRGFD